MYDNCIWCGEQFENSSKIGGVCPSCLEKAKNKEYGVSDKSSILKEAFDLVNGDRQSQYGDPIKNWTETAEIASALTGIKLTAKTCVLVLIATKLARERFKHKHDTVVDIAGYLEIYNRICEEVK